MGQWDLPGHYDGSAKVSRFNGPSGVAVSPDDKSDLASAKLRCSQRSRGAVHHPCSVKTTSVRDVTGKVQTLLTASDYSQTFRSGLSINTLGMLRNGLTKPVTGFLNCTSVPDLK